MSPIGIFKNKRNSEQTKSSLKLFVPNKKSKVAFTLAEVLITLGIIGVVAAMTLPTLIANYKEKQTVSAVKVGYSIFAQAYQSVILEWDDLSNLVNDNLTSKENALVMYNELSKYIKKVKSCDVDTNCMGDVYKTLDGRADSISWDDNSYIVTGILPNGISFWILSLNNEDGSYNGQIGIDINGPKMPNQMGKDFFHFNVDSKGHVIPGGAGTKYKLCSLSTTWGYNGYHCTAWIIQHENMDYLKYDIAEE